MAVDFTVIIPARYDSTRLPGKPLLEIAGRPLIGHVHDRAVESGATRVLVATDDSRIADTVAGFGGQVCLTSSSHSSGTERLAEAARQQGLADDEIVVNLQGDEPLLPGALIHQVAALLARFPDADMASLCEPVTTPSDLFDPHIVKVVMDARGRALYFSRAPIPWHREDFGHGGRQGSRPLTGNYFRHIGLYAYRAGFLRRYLELAACELERIESLEQLRVLYHGGIIQLGVANCAAGHGVDTEADLARVRQLIEA